MQLGGLSVPAFFPTQQGAFTGPFAGGGVPFPAPAFFPTQPRPTINVPEGYDPEGFVILTGPDGNSVVVSAEAAQAYMAKHGKGRSQRKLAPAHVTELD